MSLTIILVLALFVLLGCEGYKRLTDAPKSQTPAVQSQPRVVEGYLHKQNFVELEATDGITYVEFQTEHGTSFKEVLPYDKKLDEAKKPFYILSGKSLLFFNIYNGTYRIYFDK